MDGGRGAGINILSFIRGLLFNSDRVRGSFLLVSPLSSETNESMDAGMAERGERGGIRRIRRFSFVLVCYHVKYLSESDAKLDDDGCGSVLDWPNVTLVSLHQVA